MIIDKSRHPCFNAEVKQKLGRIHLPVAPKCNIQCNYCNRLYDCPNEGRPGVTSRLFLPDEAYNYFSHVIEKVPNISVVGIAGPGDPLANAAKTFETIRLIQRDYPEMLFCLSTNGLALMDFIKDIKELNVSHVTVTVNAVNPEIGEEIVPFINFRGKKYTGKEGAEILLHRQIKGITALKAAGIVVKVNTVVVPEKNAHHVSEIADEMKKLGVDVLNIIPVYPAKGSVFENVEEPSHSLVSKLRMKIAPKIPLMKHCGRCRADAVGLLGKDISSEFIKVVKTKKSRERFAVASTDGNMVDQHFGHARRFLIYEIVDKDISFVEERKVDNYCTGPEECLSKEERLLATISMLKDCKSVLVSMIGPYPKRRLTEEGIKPTIYCSSIEYAISKATGRLDSAEVNNKLVMNSNPTI